MGRFHHPHLWAAKHTPQLLSSEPFGFHTSPPPTPLTPKWLAFKLRLQTRRYSQFIILCKISFLVNILAGISIADAPQNSLTLIQSLAQLPQFHCARSHKTRHGAKEKTYFSEMQHFLCFYEKSSAEFVRATSHKVPGCIKDWRVFLTVTISQTTVIIMFLFFSFLHTLLAIPVFGCFNLQTYSVLWQKCPKFPFLLTRAVWTRVRLAFCSVKDRHLKL